MNGFEKESDWHIDEVLEVQVKRAQNENESMKKTSVKTRKTKKEI